MKSITDRLADRLVGKAAVAGLDRLDLSLQDYTVLADNHSARILIGFDPKLKTPTTQAVANYIQAKFDGKLEPQMATALLHAESPTPAVSVIVATSRKIRPLADAKAMIPVIANTLYLDQTIGANWEVKTSEAGKKYLACVRSEDVSGMLQSAKAKFATASFTGSRTAVGFVLPEKDDFVEFFAEDGLRQGYVTKVKDREVSITEEDGSTYVVEVPSITKMIRKNKKSLTKEQEQLIQALTPAMVDRSLAEKLVRGG